MNLTKRFGQCALPPEEGDIFNVLQWQNIHVGRSFHGSPMVFISTVGEAAPRRIRLANVSVSDGMDCVLVSDSGSSSRGPYMVVECNSSDPNMQQVFLEIMESVASKIPEACDIRLARQSLSRVIELFEALARPASRSVVGLWGELFLINEVPTKLTEVAVRAWHARISDRFDFQEGLQAIEVKVTTRGTREHRFSLHQVVTVPPLRCIVASIVTEPRSNGVSLFNLYQGIRSRIKRDQVLLSSFDRNVLSTLGDSAELAFEQCYDSLLARRSLMFVESSHIPHPLLPIPEGVSEVSFLSSLDQCSSVSESFPEGSLWSVIVSGLK